MDPELTVFYDVDTQRDFLLPEGALSVPGAERIIPRLAELTQLARRLKLRIIASTDCHQATDPELQRNGGQYPDHCMVATAGQRKIDETAPLKPIYVPNRRLTSDEIDAILAHRGEIVFEKQQFDVFAGNVNANFLLPRLLQNYADVVVYGVYTEVCVRDALAGLLKTKTNLRLHLVTDATADIGTDGAIYRRQWQNAGIHLLTVAELKARLKEGPRSAATRS
ncbi:MAG TPA: cysteine hydrolase family protein [Candidatus Binataceae bacterium]|nr:cysteine hydrolase family protein [Candidatus Binataceae bacterium]